MKISLRWLISFPVKDEIILEVAKNCSIDQMIRQYLESIGGGSHIGIISESDNSLLCVAMVNSKYKPLNYILEECDQVAVIPWIIGG